MTDSSFFKITPCKCYGFQSYISIPIMLKDGSFFGTLCAIDPKPAKLKKTHVEGMFKLFAELISFHINAIDQIVKSEANLLEERKASELREQFIAILGHDLRNPLGAAMMGTEILQDLPLDPENKKVLKTIQNSSIRMAGLIENTLDFARGHMGGGIKLNLKVSHSFENELNQIINEMHTLYPDKIIDKTFSIDKPVYCDESRIAQLFSNLLGNAIKHGKADKPIKIFAVADANEFCLSITNCCDPLSEETISHLFQPFFRGDDKSGKKGLGLGLYIASEISHAHKGELTVSSTKENISFTVKIPNAVPAFA